MLLTGTYTALITPFEKGGEKVDFAALKRLVEFQMDNGIEGLVPCGTTGESPTLDHREHEEVIAKVIEWAKARRADTTIIAGTGSNSTKEAIELTRAAAAAGADYSLQVNPYYNKPTQEGLYAHFSTIADSAKIPLILYNIPGRTGISLTIETIRRLAQHENIVGIKEATGDLNFMTQVIQETPEDFVLLSGDDNLLLPVLSIGGRGVISVVSNILPKETGEITRAWFQGEMAKAQKVFHTLFPLCKYMFIETNPIPVKYAAFTLGLCENVLRLPLTPLAKHHEAAVKSALERAQGALSL